MDREPVEGNGRSALGQFPAFAMHKDAEHLTLALLGTVLISAPAPAQTNAPASSSPATAATTQPMNTDNWITQEQPGHWRSSKLEGLNVYNNNNESIGELKDLLVDNSGKIQAVVIRVGGFLGLGEHHVAAGQGGDPPSGRGHSSALARPFNNGPRPADDRSDDARTRGDLCSRGDRAG